MPNNLNVGYITGGLVHDEFLLSYLMFVLYDKERRKLWAGLPKARGAFHATNRNQVVAAHLNTGAEWLLQIDTDMEFTPEDVYRIMDAAAETKAKIVSGLYFVYHPADRLNPAWYKTNPETLSREVVPQFSNGMQEIDACGAGFLLVHRQVFLMMEPAFMADQWRWFGHDLVKMQSGPQRLGEDLTFCHRAKELGFTIYGCGDVRPKHKKERLEDRETFQQAQQFPLGLATANPSIETRSDPPATAEQAPATVAIEECAVAV